MMEAVKELLISLTILICIHFTNSRRLSEWSTDFGNYLKNSNTEYQILLLFNPNEESRASRTDDITREISEKFPTIKISFQDATNKKARELSQMASFSTPRSTMTVIVHLSENPNYLSHLNGPINFVSNISESKMRSRCLIVLPKEQKRSSYKNLLKELWRRQFLDVTILEVSEQETLSYLRNLEEIATIHQWNPFRKGYNRTRFSPGVSWFPDKTQNLHGFQMQVGIFHFSPAVSLERDDQGEVKNPTGPDVELSKALSKAMNFRIEWNSPKNEPPWGVSKVPKENSTGYLYRIMHNEIQYIVIERGRYATADERLFEWTKGSKFISQVVVVPITQDRSIHLFASWKMFYAFLLIGFFLMILILSRLWHFDKTSWSLLNIFQLFLGSSASREPQKQVERIVYAAMLVSCMFHSSFIFTAITEVSLTVNSENSLETIEDVVSSSLHLVMQNPIYALLADNAEGSARALLDKSEIVEDYDSCLDDLLEGDNCSFVIRSDIAESTIRNIRDGSGGPIMKMVKESLMSSPTGLVMESRSPYVGRFDQVLLWLVQSGLVDKWQRSRYNESLKVDLDDPGLQRGCDSDLLYKIITHILSFGYFFAISAFGYEVLFAYCKKKIYCRYLGR